MGLSKRQLPSNQITLIYANRNKEDAIYLEEVIRLIGELKGHLILYFEEDQPNYQAAVGTLTEDTCSHLNF